MKRRIAILAAAALLMGVALRLMVPGRLEPAAKTLSANPQAAGTPPVRETSVSMTREDAATPPADAPVEPAPRPAVSESRAVTIIPSGPANANVRALEMTDGPEPVPGLAPRMVLENVRQVFRQFTARFGSNPIGTNPEITAALNGGNPRQVMFLNSEDGLRINERGEMIDNWGTPFFFHQISGTEMEIRSAGPDRKMWTADDLVIR